MVKCRVVLCGSLIFWALRGEGIGKYGMNHNGFPVWGGLTMSWLVLRGLSGFNPWIRTFCELVLFVPDAR